MLSCSDALCLLQKWDAEAEEQLEWEILHGIEPKAVDPGRHHFDAPVWGYKRNPAPELPSTAARLIEKLGPERRYTTLSIKQLNRLERFEHAERLEVIAYLLAIGQPHPWPNAIEHTYSSLTASQQAILRGDSHDQPLG